MDVSGNVNPVAAVPADSFGAIKSMRLAKLSPGNINYANAHATSTLVGAFSSFYLYFSHLI